jgi:hypothetical protein
MSTPATEISDIEACYAAGWTDGLPVVPPTRERVDEMLGSQAARKDEPILALAPGQGIATLEKIAANAVMAGCLPEYLPVVEAALLAAVEDEFWLEGCVTTVHSVCPMALVSGPIAERLGMNGGTGALGPGNRANATIGRALSLCIRNIGLGIPGGLDATTLAHPGKYSYCYTELPESPWPHFQTDRGFSADDSTVTLYGADAPLCICDYGRLEPEAILQTIAESASIPGSYNAFFRGELWLVLAPEHAEIIASAGWSKDDVRRFLAENVGVPAGRLRARGLYGFADGVVRPEWLDDPTIGEDDLIPFVQRPDQVCITVAGGPYGGYTAVIMGMGGSITRRIEEYA